MNHRARRRSTRLSQSLFSIVAFPALLVFWQAKPASAQAPAAPEGVGDLLHDNGPFVTHPDIGPGGSDVSRLQDESLDLAILGFSHDDVNGTRVADDFEVPGPNGWDLVAIVVFAYQTGSTTTSPIDLLNFRIWSGPPGEVGSTIVFGDTTTNRLSNTVFFDIYRDSESDPGLTNRPVMRTAASFSLHLDAGHYWLDWQSGGTLASGPWVPPVTILGQTTTGDALQFSDGAGTWSPLLDTGSSTPQGLPFIIYGFTDDIFNDGFESEGTGAWSDTVP